MWAANYKEYLIHMSKILFWSLVIIYIALSLYELSGKIDVPRVGSFEQNESMPLFAFNIVKLRVSILCLILVKVFYELNDRDLPLLYYLGDYSFGIYFIHIFVIKMFEWTILAIDPEFTLNSFTFLIYVGLVSVASILIVYVIKKIFGRNSRMLIGS
jgi:peptidoglycan/LPS O-acetylase OafA/YrhL